MSRIQTVLVTGAASGLGKCFAQHYLRQPGTTVIACDVNPISLRGTQKYDEQRLLTYEVDFSSEQSIVKLVSNIYRQLTAKKNHQLPQHPTIDLIVHSAGIRGLVPEVVNTNPDDVPAAETLEVMNSKTISWTFQVNTLGTFLLLQQLVEHDLLNPADSGDGSPSSQQCKVIIMTSRMGSISYNTAGGGYAYRASKAALNAIIKSMTIDLPHILFVLLHPGRVETGLTSCREKGAIEVEESVDNMLEVIDKLNCMDSGRFLDRFGKDIGW